MNNMDLDDFDFEACYEEMLPLLGKGNPAIIERIIFKHMNSNDRNGMFIIRNILYDMHNGRLTRTS